MRKQHKKWLALLLCLTMLSTLTAVSAFAEDGQSANEETVEPTEQPVEAPDMDTPLDGNWCSDANGHWRADAVNQGIPAPHVDEDGDGACDVCRWVLAVDEPTEEPVEVPGDTPLDGDWCSDANGHWRADAVNQGIPAPHVDEDGDGVCNVCRWVLAVDEPAEEPGDEPIDGGYEYDDEFHWPAGGVEYKRPHELDENGACVICGFVKPAHDEPGTDSGNEEPAVPPGRSPGTLSPARTVPQTGDQFDPALWTMMLLLSVGVLTGVILNLRKRSKQ